MPGAPAMQRAGLVSRVKQRLFPPAPPMLEEHRPLGATAPNRLPAVIKSKMTFQASIAELLLVNRLKARSQKDQAARMLERASQIIFVTCKSWFSQAEHPSTRHETRL